MSDEIEDNRAGEPADDEGVEPVKKASITDPAVKELILLMLTEGHPLQSIADATGVPRQRVADLRDRYGFGKTEAAKQGEDREEYRSTLLKKLSVKERAEKLARLAKSNNPMIALRALEMADEISQVAASSQQPPALVPIFALPKGTRVPVR